jgi:uncharacterized membrane protein YphA (DoxX/SURF4 family)
MSSASSDPVSSRFVGPDPGRSIRCWVAGFLRLGIGLSLLNSGLQGYFSQNRRGRMISNGFGIDTIGGALDPLVMLMPYVMIGFGLALILGFFTKVASIGSAFLSLLGPIYMIISTIARAGLQMPSVFGTDPMIMNLSLFTLIAYAALIWFSPLENHPISIDALIFSQNRVGMIQPPKLAVSDPTEVPIEPIPLRDHSSG